MRSAHRTSASVPCTNGSTRDALVEEGCHPSRDLGQPRRLQLRELGVAPIDEQRHVFGQHVRVHLPLAAAQRPDEARRRALAQREAPLRVLVSVQYNTLPGR